MVDVTISGNTYTSYISVTDADKYLLVDPNYTAWSALSTDDKAKNLVMATRLIDAQVYIDTASTQVLRMAISDFANACALIAAAVASGNTTILGKEVPEQDVDVMKAGSVEINYYRDFTSFSMTRYVPRWTPDVYAILSKYFASSTMTFGFSNGTSGVTTIQDFGVHW